MAYFNLQLDQGLFPSRTLAHPLLICFLSIAFYSLLLGAPSPLHQPAPSLFFRVWPVGWGTALA